MAKRGVLNWLATQSMIQLLAPLSLVDTSKTATGQSLKDLNRLVRQAHCEASDKLHYPLISDPLFVSFADTSWANRKDFGSQCGSLCVGTERSLGRECCSLLSYFLDREVNVADALTKVDNRAHELLRRFLQSRVWRIVWAPEFTSSKKFKQEKKGKQPRTL